LISKDKPMRVIALKDVRVRPMGERAVRLVPVDEEFELSNHHAKALIAVKKVRDVMRAHLPPPPPELVEKAEQAAESPAPAPVEERHAEPHADQAERDALRTLAGSMGINVSGRWGVARLQEEIEAATAIRAANAAPAAGTTLETALPEVSSQDGRDG
jgi:hypothetical protein